MKRPKLIIELMENGALVTIKNHADINGEDNKEMSMVYEFDEDNKEKLVELLYEVDNFCVCEEGKYSKERSEIKLVHGEKYDCKDDNCKICHVGLWVTK